MSRPTTTLALFDFDGTLTTSDTFLDFLRFYHGDMRFYMGMLALSPWLIAFKAGLLPNWVAKEKVLTWFWKGEENRVFLEKCREFQEKKMPNIMRAEAVACLKAHQKAGHRVIVVSASAEDWLSVWCERNRVELLATKLERVGEKLSGKLKGKNCYGNEKAVRVREHVSLDDYRMVYAYGDSSEGDQEFLELAHYPRFREFPLPSNEA